MIPSSYSATTATATACAPIVEQRGGEPTIPTKANRRVQKLVVRAI
jgi:hypothetical protein